MVVLLCIFSAIPLKLCLWSEHWFLCTPQVSTASQLFDTGIWGVQSSSAYQVSELRKNKQTSASMLEKVKTGSKGVTEFSPESLIFFPSCCSVSLCISSVTLCTDISLKWRLRPTRSWNRVSNMVTPIAPQWQKGCYCYCCHSRRRWQQAWTLPLFFLSHDVQPFSYCSKRIEAERKCDL